MATTTKATAQDIEEQARRDPQLRKELIEICAGLGEHWEPGTSLPETAKKMFGLLFDPEFQRCMRAMRYLNG